MNPPFAEDARENGRSNRETGGLPGIPDRPPSLLVEEGLDALVVTLGPSRVLVARGGLVASSATALAGLALGMGVQQPALGALIAVGGLVVGAAMRVRGWTREEAPLELVLRAHELEIRRVYRRRLLHREVVALHELGACAPSTRGLVLSRRDGAVRELVTGFRSADELAWVAAAIDERLHRGDPADVDTRIGGLLRRASPSGALDVLG